MTAKALPSRRTILQYVLVGLLGYFLGSKPQSAGSKTANMLVSRYLLEGEEEGPAEEDWQEGEGEEEGEGFDLTSDEDVTIVVVIVLILIFLTIAFEYIKDELEEHATSNLRPIVDKLFGELTVLGFLSMFTFVVTKAGYFAALSEIFFGEKEELLEIFEFVHFTIFFIMVLFVVQVLILVSEAMETEEEWMQMDKMAKDPHLTHEWERRAESFLGASKLKKNQSFRLLRDLVSLLPFMRDRKLQRREDLILFKVLRDEFLLERSYVPPFHPAPENQRVTPDFSFGRYLCICMGSMLSQVVEVSITTWIIFAFLTCIYYFYVIYMNENIFLLAWTWVALGWIVFSYNIYFERHLIQVRTGFLQKEMFLLGRVDDKTEADLTPSERTYLNSLSQRQDPKHRLPVWTDVDIDEYIRKRSAFTKWVAPGVPNRQQTLYWFDRKGPRVYLLILQSNLLFLGIYSAMNVLGFLQFMYDEPTHVFVSYVMAGLLPFLGIMFFKRHLVAVLAQVCCMGAYRRPNVVSDVLREEKTSRVVRAFIVIYKMRRFAAHADTATFNKRRASSAKKNFDKVELVEVGKTFDAFDTSGDGAISYDEFESLMNNLGAKMTTESLNNMIAMLDEDGDGEVSKDEFISWYAENAGADDLSEWERAQYLFRLFDNNGSGELTIGEFKRKLDALNVGFSIDDVGAIVHELDEDNSGTIGLEEFADLLNKYYPKELQGANQSDDHGPGGILGLFFKSGGHRGHGGHNEHGGHGGHDEHGGHGGGHGH